MEWTMNRLLFPLLAAGLLAAAPGHATQLPKSNADLEKEMAADLRERTRDPESRDAREMQQVKDAEPGNR